MTVLTEKEAREVTAAIREGVAAVSRAFTGLAWRAMGYTTWPAYCDAEIGGALKISIEDRRAVVGELRRQGKTQQQIAKELGVSVGTIHYDLKALGRNFNVENGSPESSSASPRATKYRNSIPLVREHLAHNPKATIKETVEATGIGRNMVRDIAREIGHQWTGPSLTKATPPPRLSAPGYTFAYEPKQIAQFKRMCDALASDNGRMHYAQHVLAAMRNDDQQWLDEQLQMLEYVVAYIGDLLRCHSDAGFRERLNSGWEGRDDIAEQQLSAPRLRVVSGR